MAAREHYGFRESAVVECPDRSFPRRKPQVRRLYGAVCRAEAVGAHADRVILGSDILFASGQATLTTAGKKAIDEIAKDLTSRYAGQLVRVYGYTDSDPIKRSKKLWKDNLDLSANRAMAVPRYLISRGIKADRIETIAMGATHYVAANSTKAAKAKNRRVEIFVIKK